MKIYDELNQLEVKKELNKVGKGFCLAKWYNATIWLGSGMNASCHHPPAHKIDPIEVVSNPKAIHNTKYKKQVRKQMLTNQRPPECDYCWKIEDLDDNNISDRVYKSNIYSFDDFDKAKNSIGDEDVILKTLEIAFDSNCNFACSYCNPSFSSKWQNDIKMNGYYHSLISDGGGAYKHDGSWASPYGKDNVNNPYIKAFWEWWESELQYNLEELRITGGEPTMSNDFWTLAEWWKNNPNCKVRFATNSNLGMNERKLNRFLKFAENVEHFDLYTSCESIGERAEYIRDGLEWNLWRNNLEKIISSGNIRAVNVMMTINALCLPTITQFMDNMLELKSKYGKHFPVCSLNILRFPSFQAIPILPDNMREKFSKQISDWLYENRNERLLHDIEKQGLKRLVNYIDDIEIGHDHTSDLESRLHDFRMFHIEYDHRRNKNFSKTFPEFDEIFSR